jgi:hypothetical protein
VPVAEVSRALHAGELREILAGRDPGHLEPVTPAQSADQGARSDGSVSQVTTEQLRSMSASEIVAARRAGRLRSIGVAP